MWLTELRGRTVVNADGSNYGSVRDVVVAVHEGDHHPMVSRLVVGSRTTSALIDHDAIVQFDATIVLLREFPPPSLSRLGLDAPLLHNDELLLIRDVLDTQIVDISGHRLARVADVLLARAENQRWKIDAVDVSFGRVLHRLHIPVLPKHLNEELIDWADIHLASPRGHDVQLGAPRSAVHRVSPVELAGILERLDTTSAIEVIEALETPQVADALVAGHPGTGERLLRAVSHERAERILSTMPAPHREHWRSHLASKPALRGRRFHRLRGWRRHGRSSGMHSA